jgi:hypothetical protein
MIALIRMLVALVLLSGLLVACNTPPTAEPTTAPAAPATPATEPGGYPVATAGTTEGYPAPAATTETAPGYPVPTEDTANVIVPQLTVPAPASDQVGVVTGKIFRRDTGSTENKPFAAELFLGKVLSSTQGEEGLVELDTNTSPKAQLDAQGVFVFTDVPPGKYGLFLNTPQGALLLNQPADGSAMVVEVTGGQTVDMGELSYELEAF